MSTNNVVSPVPQNTAGAGAGNSGPAGSPPEQQNAGSPAPAPQTGANPAGGAPPLPTPQPVTGTVTPQPPEAPNAGYSYNPLTGKLEPIPLPPSSPYLSKFLQSQQNSGTGAGGGNSGQGGNTTTTLPTQQTPGQQPQIAGPSPSSPASGPVTSQAPLPVQSLAAVDWRDESADLFIKRSIYTKPTDLVSKNTRCTQVFDLEFTRAGKQQKVQVRFIQNFEKKHLATYPKKFASLLRLNHLLHQSLMTSAQQSYRVGQRQRSKLRKKDEKAAPGP